jgi:hypothetical protein
MTVRTIDPLLKVSDPDVAIGDMLKGKRGLIVGGSSSGMTGDTIYIDGGLHNMA